MEHVVCLHGFGVRQSFWDTFRDVGAGRLVLHTPSLEVGSVEQALDDVATLVRRQVQESGQRVHLLGHSLGGVWAVLAGLELTDEVASVTVVSSPWGQGGAHDPGPVVKFLLARGWLPGFLVRPRFFGPGVPVGHQKALFRQAVPEAPALRELITSRPWFHTELWQSRPGNLAYPHPVQALASAHDHIVPLVETRALALALGGRFVELPSDRRWGHDDLAVSPAAASYVVDQVVSLVQGGTAERGSPVGGAERDR